MRVLLNRLAGLLLLMIFERASGSPCSNGESSRCDCDSVMNSRGAFEDHVNCSRKDLSEVPSTLPSRLTTLDFSYNKLLPENLHSICNYQNVANVSLEYNYLNELPAGELRDCHISHSLFFKGNVFNSITSESLLGLDEVRVITGLEAQHFDKDTFSELKQLEHLSISIFQAAIPSEIFDSLNLTSLTLFINKALQVPGDLFKFGSKSLTELHLESPSLQRLPGELLENLVNVEKLTLRLPDISNLPARLFQFEGQNNLQTLSISGVRTLPRGLFNGMRHLKRLKIHEMTSVEILLLRPLKKLEYLDLSGSNTEYGGILPYLLEDHASLKIMKLNDCAITSLPTSSFKGLHSLEALDMTDNRIRYLTRQPFVHVQNSLKELNLKENDISVIESSVFRNLTELELLDLSGNNIFTLAEDTFADLTNLQSLSLQRNKINTLPDGIFRSQTALKALSLAYNVFEEDPGKLLANANMLSMLDLSDNHIKTLSNALVDNLIGLSVLNLEYNPIHCDCQLLQNRGKLKARGVQIKAWCTSPAYRHLEDVIADDCSNLTTIYPTMHLTPALLTTLNKKPDTSNSQKSSEINLKEGAMQQTGTALDATSTITHSDNKLADSATIKYQRSDDTNHMKPAVTNLIAGSKIDQLPASNLTDLLINKPEEASIGADLSKQEKYYIAVAFISSVSFICIVILACLAFKNRKTRLYQISEVFSRDFEFDRSEVFSRDFEFDRLGDQPSPRLEGRNEAEMKDVPSVQIDVVDDDGNVSSVQYPASDVPIMSNNDPSNA